MDDIERFKAAVERHLQETGTTPSGFGTKFARDPNFVFLLRKGREPRRAMRERILAAMKLEQALSVAPNDGSAAEVRP